MSEFFSAVFTACQLFCRYAFDIRILALLIVWGPECAMAENTSILRYTINHDGQRGQMNLDGVHIDDASVTSITVNPGVIYFFEGLSLISSPGCRLLDLGKWQLITPPKYGEVTFGVRITPGPGDTTCPGTTVSNDVGYTWTKSVPAGASYTDSFVASWSTTNPAYCCSNTATLTVDVTLVPNSTTTPPNTPPPPPPPSAPPPPVITGPPPPSQQSTAGPDE